MSEHLEQVTLFEWVQYNTTRLPELNLLYAIPNGGKRNKTTAAKLKAEGVKAGVWDIHLPVARRGYVGLWIEMKYGKNTLTASQVEWRRDVLMAGHECRVCYSWQEAAAALEWYLGANDGNLSKHVDG